VWAVSRSSKNQEQEKREEIVTGKTASDKETVLKLGIEGGGATVFCTSTASGSWAYHVEGNSMDMDENDDEVWRSWESPPYTSIKDAIQSISKDGEWVLFYPISVHPDYRANVWEMVQETAGNLRDHLKHLWNDQRREQWRRNCLEN